MKIKRPTQPEPAAIAPQIEAAQPVEAEPETEAIAKPTPNTFVMEHDDEAGTVDFELLDGTPIQLKSPTKKQLWAVTGWLNSAGEDYRSDVMLTLKLAQICVAKWGDRPSIGFDEMLDTIDPVDFKRLGAAVSCFRDRMADFFERLAMDRPGAAVHH